MYIRRNVPDNADIITRLPSQVPMGLQHRQHKISRKVRAGAAENRHSGDSVMRRWLAVLVLALSLLLTGCERNEGYYTVVYPYTVTVAEQKFTFLGVTPLFGYTIEDAAGHRYYYKQSESDPYEVIEISYPNGAKYIWQQHMAHESIAFGDYSEFFDPTGYTPGPVLIEAIQAPAKMEFVTPQENPNTEIFFHGMDCCSLSLDCCF